MADVTEFLRRKGFSDDVIKGFLDNDIDMTCLPTITEGDLRELGIGKTFGERRRLAMAIQSLKMPTQSERPVGNIPVMPVPLEQAPYRRPVGRPVRNDAASCYRAPLTMPEHYNIRRILESNHKGRAVLRELDSGKMPSVKNRRALVQVTVAFLIENGGHLLHPTSDQKKALALAIVSQFPCMKDQLPGTQGHEYLYHKGGGFLEFRLKTLRSTAARQRGSLPKKKRVESEEMLETHSMEPSNHSGSENLHVQQDQAPGNTVETREMLQMHSQISSNQGANENIHAQMDQAANLNLTGTNVESGEMSGIHSQKSPNQRTSDNVAVHQDHTLHPRLTGADDVQSEERMEAQALQYLNQTANGIICEQQDPVSHPSSSKKNVDHRELLGLHHLKYSNQSMNDNSRVQWNQASCSSRVANSEGIGYSAPPLTRPEHYNIRGILESHFKGRAVLQDLDSGKMPSVQNRRALVQVTVAYLIENGGHLLYPTSEQKQALALAIVSQFPCMKDQLPGAQGHEYLFHKGGGFLEFRLKTLRSSAARRKASAARKDSFEQEEMLGRSSLNSESKHDHIEGRLDQESCPSPSEEGAVSYDWAADDSEEMMAIKAFLKDTHSHRHKWIQEGNLSIMDIIAVYPCYKDMPTLIDYDFMLEYGPEVADSLTSWHQTFRDPILAMARTDDSASEILCSFGDNGDMDLCALHILLELLPCATGHRCKKNKGEQKTSTGKEDAAKHVFQHMPIGTDVAAYAANKPPELTRPYLLCLGSKIAPEEYYLILDRLALPTGNTALNAFDRLFKAHYIFSVHFDHRVLLFYNFFASIVYKVTKNNISPQLRAFYLLLRNQGNG